MASRATECRERRVRSRAAGLALVLAVLSAGLPGAARSQDKQSALETARRLLAGDALGLGLTPADLDGLVVTDTYETRHNGVRHIYLRQQLGGIELANGTLTLNVGRDGELLSFGSRLTGDLAARVDTRRPALSAEEAVRAAADTLGLEIVGPLTLLADIGGPTREVIFDGAGLSLDPVPVELAYYRTEDGEIRLSWEMVIRQTDQRHWWNLWVDAATGELLAQSDWIDNDTYQVFALPKESPSDGPRTIETNPADALASPFGWHDTDGVPGAESQRTRGNNVSAQEDRDGNNFGGFRPNGGASLDFQFALDLSTQRPVDYRAAAITNLFYWNNIIHDVLYHYGFDEASGNFQENNYGRGGLGTDSVNADAQDNADGIPPSANNANFATPPDGSNPRMQMFEWLAPPDLIVNTPAAIAGTYPSAGASFGPRLDSTGVTGDLEIVDDGTASGSEGCGSLVGFTSGRIALIDRGSCEFGTKVLNAENAGAIAAIVVNNAGDGLVNMGAGAQGGLVTIPSLFIGQTDGGTIKGQLPAPGVNATMRTAQLDRDSDLDSGVIAHEYCHGLSNRLTGGPASVNCLLGDQQAGEGWSDLCTLLFSVVAGDQPQDPHGIGTYLIFQPPNGPGIRPAPYSTDLGVNPLTYGDLVTAGPGGVSIPHGVGTVWATAVWEMYWNLVDTYGFDADLYTGTGGNNIAIQLVVDGLKLQPCNPTFLDARDAILAADVANNGGANECLIWQGFAKRGMGVSAADGGGSGSLAVTEAFDLPAQCINTAPAVAITAPADLAAFDVADTIGFTGTADDLEEGDLSGALAWTSDLDGAIGGGGSFSSGLSVGFHTVTAAVTDSGGLTGSDGIRLVVEDPPGCPADLVVPTLVSGTNDFDAVNSVTVGAATVFDGTSVTTIEAGNFVVFEDDVTVGGSLTVGLTPTPCA